jgi:hypothetical protein
MVPPNPDGTVTTSRRLAEIGRFADRRGREVNVRQRVAPAGAALHWADDC